MTRGVVLCGGNSSRMGKDKGSLLRGETTWAQQAADKLLQCLQVSPVISINASQLNFYQQLFPRDQLLTDNEQIQVAGPLSGILSAHEVFPNDDLLVLACDLPEMKSEVLNELLMQHRKHHAFDAVAYEYENRLEPLCAVYSALVLSKISKDYQLGQLSGFSVSKLMGQMNTLRLPIKSEWGPAFKNFNAPADLLP